MSLVLDGTNGLSEVDGSAATPAIRGTDTNTGIFFPAADTIAFAEGGAEVARFDNAGNLLVGTTSSSAKLHVATSTGGDGIRITSTATAALKIFNNNQTTGSFEVAQGFASGSDNVAYVWNNSNAAMVFGTNATERARIDSSGNLLVGKSSNNETIGEGFIIYGGPTNKGIVSATFGTSTSRNTYHLYNDNATNLGYRFYVNVNGGIYNYSGNNVNLSDERTKTNIESAGGYLEKICAIPVKLFNYKDEAEGEQRTLGVIAQDVEAVAPEFVNNDGWEGTNPEDGVPLKTIYTTDMMFGLMKAIQEQQALITALTAQVAALDARLISLEGTQP
jgi:hypothetical protein